MTEKSDPDQRLLQGGVTPLSDAELLSVLLGGGRLRPRTDALASELLEDFGSLAGLAEAKETVQAHRGMKPRRTASLLAAIELACRLAKAHLPHRLHLDRPSRVAYYLDLRYNQPDQEVMGALYLDVRHRLILEREVYRGCLDRAAVEPRAILKEGLIRSASCFVLFHTHPSGDPSPSTADLSFTRRMAEAADLVGMKMLDHVVLGSRGRWVSVNRLNGW